MGNGEYRHGCDNCVSSSPADSPCHLPYLTCLLSAISAYALEKYPQQATCVSAILNMWRTCGGFAVGYFQPAWILRNGLGLVFAIQAAIVIVAAILTISPVFIWERRRRSQREAGDV